MALDMLEARVLASSFGYDAVKSFHKGDIRHLTEIRLHEVSAVTFPANPHARVLSVKSFFVPPNYPGKQPAQGDWQKMRADMRKADELFNQLINQGIKAYQQYKWEHR